MAEVGWVGFARMTLRVVEAVLLAYRAKFCKHMRKRFPHRLCAPRARVFSSLKRKLGFSAPGRSLATQRLQALLLGIAYHLYLLTPCPHQIT